jgi:hypothetical protein
MNAMLLQISDLLSEVDTIYNIDINHEVFISDVETLFKSGFYKLGAYSLVNVRQVPKVFKTQNGLELDVKTSADFLKYIKTELEYLQDLTPSSKSDKK